MEVLLDFREKLWYTMSMRWIEVYFCGGWMTAWVRGFNADGAVAQLADDAPFRLFRRWREIRHGSQKET